MAGAAAVGVAAPAAWIAFAQSDGARRAAVSNVGTRETPRRALSVPVPMDKVKVLNAGALPASSAAQVASDAPSDAHGLASAGEGLDPPAAMGGASPIPPKPARPTPQSTPPETYRTVCVRLCDGGYFAISFATTPAQFARDEAVCQRSCGKPVRLYVYRNPGAIPDYMHDLDGNAYAELVNAFRFRSSYDPACTCSPQPWTLAAQDRHQAYALQGAGAPGTGRVASQFAARPPQAADADAGDTAANGAADGAGSAQLDSTQPGPLEPRGRKRAARPAPASLAAAIEGRGPAPRARRREAASRRFDGTDWRITPSQPF